MRHVFLIGSNGIPASYGGFETFVEQLTAHRKDPEIFYHVSCLSEKRGEFEYNHARCFQIKVPKLGHKSKHKTIVERLRSYEKARQVYGASLREAQ